MTRDRLNQNRFNTFKKYSTAPNVLGLATVILFVLINQIGYANTASWSLHFNNLDLFNLPNLGRSLFGVTESPGRNTDSELGFRDVDPDVIEDSMLKTPQLVKKYGYPIEVHHIKTQDGYILEMHRIARQNATPVLLTHGLLDSSATWVMMGPEKGLAYHLYNSGYDVWMTNVRGNTYSRNHIKYKTTHAKFWDFTFHEMGVYDVPASIDYIINTTGYEKLHYVGHSQGTLIYWIMCSEKPYYNDKIITMQALAPVAFIKHTRSPVIDFLAFVQEPLSILMKMIGAHEFLPNDEFLSLFYQMICDETTIATDICSNVLFIIAGYDRAQLNETMLPVILGHAPAGAATKQMTHFGQLKKSGKFRQYDYGWIRNHWIYDSVTPPEYRLNSVSSKVALHYAKNDWLSTVQDVEHLNKMLPNVIEMRMVDYPDFNHLDFVWGIDVYDLLYKHILEIMKQADDELGPLKSIHTQKKK